MKGVLDSEPEHRPPPPVAGDTGCNHNLTRSNSDASSLTVGNCKNFFRRSENVTLDECTVWTNQKHNSYIYNLEMSFVEQLYQQNSILAHCSGHNVRGINISQKQLINVHNASEQNGCWQNINSVVGELIFGSTSADSQVSPESKRTHHSKCRGVPCHQSPSKMPASLKLISTWKQGKGIIYHGIQTRSQDRSNGDLIDLTREGTGQNFLEEDNQSAPNFESRAKRLKIALGDGLHQNQIAPSRECPASDFQS